MNVMDWNNKLEAGVCLRQGTAKIVVSNVIWIASRISWIEYLISSGSLPSAGNREDHFFKCYMDYNNNFVD